MTRRYIPTDYTEDMLDAIAELSGHFATCVYDALTDKQREEIYQPLWRVCDMYNAGDFDFESDLYSPEYQEILSFIPKSYMFLDIKRQVL
jgi:hypothetical protein